jgi:hypothetical protein
MNYNTFTGRILDWEAKAFVDGVKVTLELDGQSHIIHTDSEGFYRVNANLNEESASARIRVEVNGYEKYNRNITLSSKDNKIEEIYLTPIKNKSKISMDKVVGVATVLGTIISLAALINPFASQQQAPSKQNCDPAYPDFCISQSLSNLKCQDVKQHNFKVLPPDPHNFDRNKDGVGCEK